FRGSHRLYDGSKFADQATQALWALRVGECDVDALGNETSSERGADCSRSKDGVVHFFGPSQFAIVRSQRGSPYLLPFQDIPFALVRRMFGAINGAEFFASPTTCKMSQCSIALLSAFVL